MLRALHFIWSIIRRIYLHFDTLPKAVELENSRFYTVANLAQTLAWFVHLCWFFILYRLEVYPFAWFQIFSIACYVAAIVFNRHAYHMTSMGISLIEIMLHQIIAVKILGAEVAFQYFIPVVAIFPFLIPRGSVLVKACLLFLCTACFIYIELHLKKEAPLFVIDQKSKTLFSISNLILSFGFIGLWAYYLNVAIYRAEIILQKRTTELAVSEQKVEQEKIQRELEVKDRDNEIFRLRNIELKESYDQIVVKNRQIEEEKNKSRSLLLNILPEETANELLDKGKATTKRYVSTTVLFADFVGFTTKAEMLNAEDLVLQIDRYFNAFDKIMKRHGIEKIKTIGDAYMAAGGLPIPNNTHPRDVVQAAREMLDFVHQEKQENPNGFDIRIGISTGPLVAGVVGNHKFQYDIWGDTVNIAARMEQNSESGKINIAGTTYELIRDHFHCTHRGKIDAKNKGKIDMYFVELISSES
jgi:class 3 adenylate cyclase